MTQPGFSSQIGPDAGAQAANASDVVATGIVNILPAKRYFGTLTFDAVVTEAHGIENKLLKYPIETGGSVHDHAYQVPRVLVLTVAVADLQGTPTDIFSLNTSQSRSRNAWDAIKLLADNFELLDVQTGLELYTSMCIQSVKAVQDVATARVLQADITLEHVRFVSPQTIANNGGVSSARAGGVAGTVNAGNKPGTPVTPPASWTLRGATALGYYDPRTVPQ
jgi:hypothetical protein